MSAEGQPLPPRLAREARTVEAMIALYCRGQRHTPPGAGLCAECQRLAIYARLRLARCGYGAAKPTCARCPIHCYSQAWRERIRTVMRYAGPRMLWHHPVLALGHLLDGLRRPPASPPQPPEGSRHG